MDSRQRYWLTDRISTVATTLTMWWQLLVASSGTVSATAFSKFILPIYTILALALVYGVFIPFAPRSWLLFPPYLTGVVYYGRLKMFNLYHRSFRQQWVIHVHMWVVWTHVLALLRHWQHASYHEFVTQTLFDVMFPFHLQSACRGHLYAVVWYVALVACLVTHVVHVYWTLTWKVQMVSTVKKKYQMLPPAPKIKKK